ncbi:MAG TPA: DoxX family protein [Nitrospira sp.]|nr:DoxX family protein [Nitrospira sp.]
MQSATRSSSVSNKQLWLGRTMSAMPALFLLVDGAMKLVKPEVVIKATVELGYAESVIVPLGIVLLTCTILYLVPRTAVLGAILLTGYLGGAVATHVRAGQGLFEILFPVVFGALLWGGLMLRDERLRELLPLRD